MRLSIEPTPEFFMAGEVMVRLWQGTAEDGSPVVALVTAVGFAGQAEALSEGLVSIPPPTEVEARAWAETILSGKVEY